MAEIKARGGILKMTLNYCSPTQESQMMSSDVSGFMKCTGSDIFSKLVLCVSKSQNSILEL